jgi:hypothetical protein
MATMKKRAIAAITAGVWLAAIGSAAAVTYDLNRPLAVRGASQDTQGVPESAATPTEAPRPPVTALASPVQMMPTVTVVGNVHPRAVHPASKAPLDISKMHCGEWRQLEMGSGNVQECE